jgi:hypothetical protein
VQRVGAGVDAELGDEGAIPIEERVSPDASFATGCNVVEDVIAARESAIVEDDEVVGFGLGELRGGHVQQHTGELESGHHVDTRHAAASRHDASQRH